MRGHTVAEGLAKAFVERQRNEADTRHQILDVLLHDVLEWPRETVKCEESVHEGYIDYVLRDKADRTVLLVEAKKESIYFELPASVNRGTDQRTIRLRTLASNKAILNAV